MARSKKGQFIQKAIKHPGAFHAYCAKKGFPKVNEQCIRIGLHSKNPHVRKQANLARNLAKLRKIPRKDHRFGHYNKSASKKKGRR